MEFARDSSYPHNNNNSPNRQRQCDLNPAPYNYPHHSYQLPRPNFVPAQPPYDPVHDQSNYNNGSSHHMQNNVFGQSGGFGTNAYPPGYSGRMPSMPNMPAMPMSMSGRGVGTMESESDGATVPQNHNMSFNPFSVAMNEMARNTAYAQHYAHASGYQPQFGAPAQAMPVQNAPFFGYVFSTSF